MARNKYLGYTLLHSAAHLGGRDGEILARATLAHCPEGAQRLIKMKSKNQKTPLGVAKDYNAAKITKLFWEITPKHELEDNSMTIQSLDS